MARTSPSFRYRLLISVAATTLVVSVLALFGTGASATTAVRRYRPTLMANTTCVAPGSVNRITATITNSPTSNRVLGSAVFHSDAAHGFRDIFRRTFTRPEASGGKTWQALPDLVDADGIFLRATKPSQALSPGESVTVTFQAKAPSASGEAPWSTAAWESTLFLSGRFSLDVGASNPSVTVDGSCPATFPNGGTVVAPGATLEVVPNDTINCDAAYDGTFPGFAGTVQITPDPEGPGTVLVTFDDPNGADHPHAPFCKGMAEGPPVILTFPEDSCASEGPATPPCIVDQFVGEDGHLVTQLLIDANDPPVRH